MFCGKCGNQLEDNAKFCPVCGAAVEGAAKPKTEAGMSLNISASALPLITVLLELLTLIFYFTDTIVAKVEIFGFADEEKMSLCDLWKEAPFLNVIFIITIIVSFVIAIAGLAKLDFKGLNKIIGIVCNVIKALAWIITLISIKASLSDSDYEIAEASVSFNFAGILFLLMTIGLVCIYITANKKKA